MCYRVIFDTTSLLKKDLSVLKKNRKQALLIKEKIEQYAEASCSFCMKYQGNGAKTRKHL